MTGVQTCALPISRLMDASNCFEGFGEKKLSILIQHLPNILNLSHKLTSNMIINIPGFSDISADKIITNVPVFKDWLNDHSMLQFTIIESNTKDRISNKLTGIKVVMTGFRDEELTKIIESHDGIVSDNLNKETSILLAKDISSFSSKIEKANKLGKIGRAHV